MYNIISTKVNLSYSFCLSLIGATKGGGGCFRPRLHISPSLDPPFTPFAPPPSLASQIMIFKTIDQKPTIIFIKA